MPPTDIDSPSSNELLRLKFCPQCSYSLEGLATEGVCPECGRAYDQSWIIIRCHRQGSLLLGSALFGGFFLWAVLSDWGRRQPSALIAAVCGVGMMIGATIERYASPLKGASLLWISQRGVGVRGFFDLKALHVRAGEWFAIGFVLSIFAWLVAPFGSMFARHWGTMGPIDHVLIPMIGLGLFLILPARMLLRYCKERAKQKTLPEDIGPQFMEWGEVQRYEFAVLKNDVVRLRFWQRLKRKPKQAPAPRINVRFDLPPHAADALESYLADWSAPRGTTE